MPRDATAFVVLIGNELLSGKTPDTNGSHAARRLRDAGIELTGMAVVPDDVARIAEAVGQARRQAKTVITSGGIGPTHDDVTVAGVARAFDRPLVRHAEFQRRLERLYGERVNEAVLRMADLPEGARLAFAEAGFPLVVVETVHLLPGMPHYFQELLARLCESLAARAPGPFAAHRLHTRLQEGELADLLRRLQADHPEVAIGSYPHFQAGTWTTEITIDARDPAHARAAMTALTAAVPADTVLPPHTPQKAR